MGWDNFFLDEDNKHLQLHLLAYQQKRKILLEASHTSMCESICDEWHCIALPVVLLADCPIHLLFPLQVVYVRIKYNKIKNPIKDEVMS